MKKIIPLLLITFLFGCDIQQTESKYLRWIGDIEFESSKDNPEFKLCNGANRVAQYFHFEDGLMYNEARPKILKRFQTQYKPVENNQSGWLRIRFIVNCKGEAGMFRVISSDINYQEMKFDKRITSQLLDITKQLNIWSILSQKGNPKDYYQYLIFKIENGTIKEILP